MSRQVGNFNKAKNVTDITFADFANPWNFYKVFLSSDITVINWLQDQGLLVRDLLCPSCGAETKLSRRSQRIDGYVLKCPQRHEITIRLNSFFERSKIPIRDILQFIYCFYPFLRVSRHLQVIIDNICPFILYVSFRCTSHQC